MRMVVEAILLSTTLTLRIKVFTHSNTIQDMLTTSRTFLVCKKEVAREISSITLKSQKALTDKPKEGITSMLIVRTGSTQRQISLPPHP